MPSFLRQFVVSNFCRSPELREFGAVAGRSAERYSWSQEEEAKFRHPIQEKFDRESSAYFSTARLWDDAIIDPADTRVVLGCSLAVARRVGCEPNETKPGVFRM